MMKAIALFTFLFFAANAYSQTSAEKFLDSTLIQLKGRSQTDKNDWKVFSLLEDFYNESLQSDKGELTAATAQKVNAYMGDGKIKNQYLLIIFLMYQDHISQTAARGKTPDAAYQLACISLLEKEMQSLYHKLPAIVYIYKAEALETAGRGNEAKTLVEESLKKVPDSVPLKVYKYLGTRDETTRLDLVKNHSGHWMVQQFGIR